MEEADWLRLHQSSTWLSDFESLASAVIGADATERESSERLLKMWVDSQPDPFEQLLKALKTSRHHQAIMVGVLLLKNAALKKWGQQQEGKCQHMDVHYDIVYRSLVGEKWLTNISHLKRDE